MRVVIFIDGKNFYAGWRDTTASKEINFRRLAAWVVQAVGGTKFMGAYYYTGVDTAVPALPGQDRLDHFLEHLANQPGFFVQTFQQKMRSSTCAQCGAVNRFSTEKEVDTTITADMLRLAAVGAFDTAVLLSGDADLVPALDGVRALGKQAFVASWNKSGLSARLRQAAFDHVDLLQGLPQFAAAPGEGIDPSLSDRASGEAAALVAANPDAYTVPCLDEIRRAQEAMPGGYVGVHFFVTRWRSNQLAEVADIRRRAIDKLVADQKIEIYLTADGIQALRLKTPDATTHPETSQQHPAHEELVATNAPQQKEQ